MSALQVEKSSAQKLTRFFTSCIVQTSNQISPKNFKTHFCRHGNLKQLLCEMRCSLWLAINRDQLWLVNEKATSEKRKGSSHTEGGQTYWRLEGGNSRWKFLLENLDVCAQKLRFVCRICVESGQFQGPLKIQNSTPDLSTLVFSFSEIWPPYPGVQASCRGCACYSHTDRDCCSCPHTGAICNVTRIEADTEWL